MVIHNIYDNFNHHHHAAAPAIVQHSLSTGRGEETTGGGTGRPYSLPHLAADGLGNTPALAIDPGPQFHGTTISDALGLPAPRDVATSQCFWHQQRWRISCPDQSTVKCLPRPPSCVGKAADAHFNSRCDLLTSRATRIPNAKSADVAGVRQAWHVLRPHTPLQGPSSTNASLPMISNILNVHTWLHRNSDDAAPCRSAPCRVATNPAIHTNAVHPR